MFLEYFLHTLIQILVILWFVIVLFRIITFFYIDELGHLILDNVGNNRVSVIVPARNEEKNITRCLKSLQAQDYDNFEVIASLAEIYSSKGENEQSLVLIENALEQDSSSLLIRLIQLKLKLNGLINDKSIKISTIVGGG